MFPVPSMGDCKTTGERAAEKCEEAARDGGQCYLLNGSC